MYHKFLVASLANFLLHLSKIFSQIGFGFATGELANGQRERHSVLAGFLILVVCVRGRGAKRGQVKGGGGLG